MCKFAPRGQPRLGFGYWFPPTLYFKYLRIIPSLIFFSSLKWYWSYMGGKMMWVFDWRSALYIFVCVCARLSYCGTEIFNHPELHFVWRPLVLQCTLAAGCNLIIAQFLWNTFADFTWFDWFATSRNTWETEKEFTPLSPIMYIINISF